MTALIISRYGAFNQGTLMTNLAYDVALSIRTAQSFGVSVKGTENTGAAFNQTFTNAYGVHFDKTTSSPGVFYTYIDANNDGFYASPAEWYSTYTLKQGASVSSLCVGADGQTCTVGNLSSLDVSFRRPDPSAILCATASDSTKSCGNGTVAYNFAKIVLTSSDGQSSRTVMIRGNGQISVLN